MKLLHSLYWQLVFIGCFILQLSQALVGSKELVVMSDQEVFPYLLFGFK